MLFTSQLVQDFFHQQYYCRIWFLHQKILLPGVFPRVFCWENPPWKMEVSWLDFQPGKMVGNWRFVSSSKLPIWSNFIATKNTTNFPRSFLEGKFRLLQGNLGWWNIIIYSLARLLKPACLIVKVIEGPNFGSNGNVDVSPSAFHDVFLFQREKCRISKIRQWIVDLGERCMKIEVKKKKLRKINPKKRKGWR